MTQNILMPCGRRGFTLAEIMLVAVVFSVTAMMALPRLASAVERMRAEEGRQILLTVYAAQKRHWQENNKAYTGDAGDLDITFRPSAHFGAVQLDPSGSPLAQLERTTGAYTLTVDTTGRVSCQGTPCSKLGLD